MRATLETPTLETSGSGNWLFPPDITAVANGDGEDDSLRRLGANALQGHNAQRNFLQIPIGALVLQGQDIYS